MLNLVHAEFYKLQKSIGLKICFLLSCISGASLIYISHCIAIGSMGIEVKSTASGLTEIVIVSLLGSLMTGILICSDFETKSIHDAVACANGRMSVVLSKTLMYIIYMIMLLLPYMVATLIGFCSGAKFSTPFVASVYIQMLSDVTGKSVAAGTVGKIILISLVSMIVSAARLSVCIPVAFKIRKPVAVLAIGFAFNALIDLVIGLFKNVPVISDILTFTPFSRKFILVTVHTTTGILIKAVICSIIFIAVMAVVTYISFKKDEIK